MTDYRPDINGLRGVAVLSVILFHGEFGSFTGGYVGVDVFFVISGYLITSIIARDITEGRFSVVRFYDRRIRRIFPAYFSVTILTTLLALLVLPPDELLKFGRSSIAAALFVANIYFAEQMSYFQDAAGELPLLHMWSLSVEEQFYIIWPLVVFLLLLKVFHRFRGAIILATVVASLAITEWALANKSTTMVFFYTPFRIWEFLFGSFLALHGFRPPRARWLVEALGVAAIAMIAAAVVLYQPGRPAFPGASAILPCLGAAILIFVGQDKALSSTRLMSWRPLVWVGLISYSLYLIHWPLFALLKVYVGGALSHVQSAVVIAISVALAYLSWRFIEQPFRGTAYPVLSRRFVPIAGGLTVMVVLAGFGSLLVLTDGAHFRGNPAARIADAQRNQTNPMTSKCLRAATLRQVDPRRPQCVLGGPAPTGRTRIILWGDSHANSYSPAFAVLARSIEGGIEQATMQSCNVTLFKPDGKTANRSRGACLEFNQRLLDRFRKDDAVSIVILSQFWSSAYLDLKYAAKNGASTPGGYRDSVGFKTQFRRLEALVTTLTRLGKRVVLMGQPPVFPTGGGRCIVRARFQGRPDSVCDVSRAGSDAMVGPANRMLVELDRKYADVVAFIPTRIFCDDATCRPTIASGVAYRDRHHLSVLGARALAGRLKRLLDVRLSVGEPPVSRQRE